MAPKITRLSKIIKEVCQVLRYLEGKEVYLDRHRRPRSQIDFKCMKFKTKSTFKNYEKIKVNLYQICGEPSQLEGMTKENVANPTISK